MKFRLKRAFYHAKLDPEQKAIFKHIKLKGYYVLPQFYSRAQCELLSQQVLTMMLEQSAQIKNADDKRLFGAENFSADVLDFKNNSFLQEIASAVNQKPSSTAFVLAGMLGERIGGSSGAGWHRDSFFSQFKAMVYLTDVAAENGPFQILEGSHHLFEIIKDMFKAKLRFMQNRLAEDEVKSLAHLGKRLKTFTAPAGTLILFNSSAIHRGSPIEAGSRISLTNYYYEDEIDRQKLHMQFGVGYLQADNYQ
ncbi:MAG: hypothetical protein K0Q57_47 [Gammaproteobacteria bacterium]|nr:hypothetical protein [Gammaproteobacteria bacterium]